MYTDVDLVRAIPYRGEMTSEPSRRRDAVATREAILESAVRNFARAGYDGVGVREIAGDAGVTAMLVNRYFGSKEQLFAEAVDVSFATPVFVPDGSHPVAGDAAAALLSRTGEKDLTPFLIMLRSASNARATEIVRDAIDRYVGKRLAKQLPESGRQLRSDVFLSVISGVLLMRNVVGTRALNARSGDRLEQLLAAVFDAVVSTPLE